MDRRYAVAGGSALFVFLVDRITKLWVVKSLAGRGPVEVTPFFNLVYVGNTGGAFGVAQHRGSSLFIVVSLFAVLVVLALLRKVREDSFIAPLSLGAILGGGVGNLLDRLIYGYVVDFLDFHIGGLHWPAFNLADSAIVVGVFAFALLYRPRGDRG